MFLTAGEILESELLTYRKFGSPLEGHPSMEFEFTEAATGSLGQGLSIGVGMALAAKMDKLSFKTYVLLGDGEMAEGQIWEACALASYYKLNNLIGIVDVNRLGQSGETMLGWNVKEYQKRISSFGWETVEIDGHNFSEISHGLSFAQASHNRPVMIIAKTIKGKGLSFLENKEDFHGKALPHEKMGEALKLLGTVDKTIRGKISKPEENISGKSAPTRKHISHVAQEKLSNVNNVAQFYVGDLIATRKAYGQALADIGSYNISLVVLDAEVSNSTYSGIFVEKYPRL